MNTTVYVGDRGYDVSFGVYGASDDVQVSWVEAYELDSGDEVTDDVLLDRIAEAISAEDLGEAWFDREVSRAESYYEGER